MEHQDVSTLPSKAPQSCHPRLEEKAALYELAELLFFAYRDFTGHADVMLADYHFGRAHHRVIHFVSRNPGLRVGELLDILKITKQSLNRVLRQLIDRNFVTQRRGKGDRRERRLYLTLQGHELAARLAEMQLDRIAKALSQDRVDMHAAARVFLTQLIDHAERDKVVQLIANGAHP